MPKRLVVFAVCTLLLHLSASCSQPIAEFPVGKRLVSERWETNYEGEYVTLVFYEDNTYELTFRGQYMMTGEYYIEDDILHYVTVEAQFDTERIKEVQEASYRWKVKGDIVAFEVVGEDLLTHRWLGMLQEWSIQS